MSRKGVAVIARLRDLAPYAAIELVVPGGSIMALVVWLYRRQVADENCDRHLGRRRKLWFM